MRKSYLMGQDKMYALTEADSTRTNEMHYQVYQEGELDLSVRLRLILQLNQTTQGVIGNYGEVWSPHFQEYESRHGLSMPMTSSPALTASSSRLMCLLCQSI